MMLDLGLLPHCRAWEGSLGAPELCRAGQGRLTTRACPAWLRSPGGLVDAEERWCTWDRGVSEAGLLALADFPGGPLLAVATTLPTI